jgi:TM2 domain-containing membrane protein YozV
VPIGARVQCGSCNHLWKYDKPGPADFDGTDDVRFVSEIEPTRETTQCRFCGEEILRVARKCKHCGEFLDPALRNPGSATYVTHTVVHQEPKWSPGVAAVLSLLIPGAGQMYKGHVLRGLLWLIFVPVGYIMLVIPGLILHALCIILAASGDPYA